MAKKFLIELRNDYVDWKDIYIIMDNAWYNRSYEVQDLAKELNIKIEYLLPYSPNLNLIERLWKFMNNKVLKNKYYKDFKAFLDWIFNFCSNLSEYKQDIDKIFSQNFEIV